MARIQINTTIDITNTKVRHPEQGTEKQFNQFRNYTTFLQVVGLRSLFNIVEEPALTEKGWTFVIETDRDSVYEQNNDPLYFLKEDLDQVPIVTGLDEIKAIKNPVIKVLGKTPNTFVSLLQ
jgi:hypothetical protein